MKKLIPAFVALAALSLVVTACGSKEKKGAKESSAQAASKDGPMGSPAKITLAPVADAGWGYQIQVPKGAKALQKDEYGHTYSLPLPGGLFEYSVNLSKAGAKSLDQLVRNATMVGQKKIAEKKAVAGGFLVVKAPQGMLQEVWFSKQGKTAKLTVKCSGPKKGKDLMVKICTSLKVTK